MGFNSGFKGLIINVLSAVDVTSCGLVGICAKLVGNFEMSVNF
jgi:hypothetical protein